jgi:hypothetical protein
MKGDTDGSGIALDAHPLVLFGIAEILWVHYFVLL